MKRAARKRFLIEKMRPYFDNAKKTEEYVIAHLARKQRNLICRRIRLARKANMHPFNYFCTFTYDGKKHDCFIGVINDYDSTRMVTIDDLKYHIIDRLRLKEAFEKDILFTDYAHGIKGWILVDYCDKRKSTDLTRFEYCPYCGKKIDWKALKDGEAK